MRNSLLLSLGILGLILPISALASSETLLMETYDTDATPNGTSVLGWSGGNIANTSVAYTDGVGLAGSRGVLFMNDFLSQWDGYVASQYQNGNVNGNTSPNLSDYTLSFHLNVMGPVAFNAIQLNVRGSTDHWWAGTWTETGAGAVPVNPVLGPQTISVNLADAAIWPSNGLIPTFGTVQFQFQINGWQLAGGGPAIGEMVVLDELTFTMVPEPSALALAGLGAAALLLRRRRS